MLLLGICNYILLLVLYLSALCPKKYTLANCFTQHCTTHTVQTHLILLIMYEKTTQLKVGGEWQQMIQITSSRIALAAA